MGKSCSWSVQPRFVLSINGKSARESPSTSIYWKPSSPANQSALSHAKASATNASATCR
ncbi:hypothetical protein V6Z11_A12G077700 [Gossypium hirsutum]